MTLFVQFIEVAYHPNTRERTRTTDDFRGPTEHSLHGFSSHVASWAQSAVTANILEVISYHRILAANTFMHRLPSPCLTYRTTFSNSSHPLLPVTRQWPRRRAQCSMVGHPKASATKARTGIQKRRVNAPRWISTAHDFTGNIFRCSCGAVIFGVILVSLVISFSEQHRFKRFSNMFLTNAGLKNTCSISCHQGTAHPQHMFNQMTSQHPFWIKPKTVFASQEPVHGAGWRTDNRTTHWNSNVRPRRTWVTTADMTFPQNSRTWSKSRMLEVTTVFANTFNRDHVDHREGTSARVLRLTLCRAMQKYRGDWRSEGSKNKRSQKRNMQNTWTTETSKTT